MRSSPLRVQLARQRFRLSAELVVQVSCAPLAVTPVAPAGLQNAPALTAPPEGAAGAAVAGGGGAAVVTGAAVVGGVVEVVARVVDVVLDVDALVVVVVVFTFELFAQLAIPPTMLINTNTPTTIAGFNHLRRPPPLSGPPVLVPGGGGTDPLEGGGSPSALDEPKTG